METAFLLALAAFAVALWRGRRLRAYLIERLQFAHARLMVATVGPMTVDGFIERAVAAVRAAAAGTISGFVLPCEVTAQVSRIDLASWGPDAQRVPFRVQAAVMALVDADQLVAFVQPVIVIAADPSVPSHHPRFALSLQHVDRMAAALPTRPQSGARSQPGRSPARANVPVGLSGTGRMQTRLDARSGVPTRWHPARAAAHPAAVREPTRRVCAIAIEDAGERGPEYECAEGVHVIGRATDCAVRIDNETISERHCELTVAREDVSVYDLRSTNGTLVAGRGWASQPVGLRDNDVICLSGEVRLVVLRGAQPADDEHQDERE